MFCLIGIAVRIAQRLGLHRDAEQFHLAPFEVELRRRLWWQLVVFDKRIAEITGSTITALASSKGDCKWPLNINDTDLHVHAKDRPAPHIGPTEMLFCLTRFELTAAADIEGTRTAPNLSATGGKPKFQYSTSPHSSDVVTNAANHNLPIVDLDSYVTWIEDKYLKHCDPKVPLHLFTLLMTRQAVSKLRIIDYLCHGHLQQHPDPKAVPAGPERALRESIFEEGVRVLEYDIMIQGHEALQGFKWFTTMHFPLPAYMYLVGELKYITSGEMCERAWTAIIEDFDKRGMVNNLRSPMHTAMGGMMLKAWDAYEAAKKQMGKPLSPPPQLIGILRDRAKSMNTSSKDASSSSQHSGPESSSRVNVNASSGQGGYVGGQQHQQQPQQQQQHPQQQQPQPPDMNMHSAGSSPPIVSAPGAGGMESMGGAMFPGAGFEGINAHMFSSGVMPSDMDFGAMDWSSVSTWGGAFATGYDPFTQPGMSGP